MRMQWTGVAAAGILLASATLTAAPKASLGFAASDYPFLIEKSEVIGNGAVLAGEAVSTGYLPAALHLNDGAEYILGIGSSARIFDDRIALEGVSLEIVGPGERLRAIEAAGLILAATNSATKATIYTDRADQVAVRVARGSIEVRRPDGRSVRTVGEGQATLFADTRSELKVRDAEAAPYIARIQLRQIEHMEGLEQGRPSVRRKRTALAAMLAGAGAVAAGAAAGGGATAAVPASSFAPTGGGLANGNLLGTVSAVDEQLNQADTVQTGCSNATCQQSTVKLVTTNIFFGYVIGLPFPFPGCALCIPGSVRP